MKTRWAFRIVTTATMPGFLVPSFLVPSIARLIVLAQKRRS